jgi:hypothetical protein
MTTDGLLSVFLGSGAEYPYMPLPFGKHGFKHNYALSRLSVRHGPVFG